ncbi:MAG: type secretion system protein [Armatimonadetes bacterium]|jgi:type II secretory pathway component GspD/PulD (secretin)|nr:type secretion system protein [Armatimonadota bacterium]
MSPKSSHFQGYPRRFAVLALTGVMAFGTVLASSKSFAAEQSRPAPSGERKVRLDFVQADINDVAKALSIQSGVNVVLMPTVKGQVTLRLTDLMLEDALKKVAAAVGADVRKFDSTYFLGSTVELRAMVARTGVKQSLPVQYIEAEDAKGLIQHAFPYLTVETIGKAKLLVLAGVEEEVQAAMALVRDRDLAPPAVPEPKKPEPEKPVLVRETYGVRFARPAVLIDTLAKAVPDVKVTLVEKTLVIEGFAPAQAQASKLLSALDTQGAEERVVRAYKLKYLHPHQASSTLKTFFPNLTIQAGFEAYAPAAATFKPLSLETNQAFSQQGLQGAEGTAGPGTSLATGAGGPQDLRAPGSRSRTIILAGPAAEVEQATQVLVSEDFAPQQVIIEARVVDISPEKTKQLGFLWDWNALKFTERGGGVADAGKAFGAFARTPFQFDVTMDALERNRDARVLAKPNISVIDGEEASIFIGDILRYERLESVTAVGQTFTIETVPVGVALLCRPRVTGNDIVLRVHPVVSTVTDFTGRNNDIPITASREADSTIKMKDGETIAIGGLLREEDIRTLSKVPFAGDLPLIGQLFRHRNNVKRKSEVTIFLTARVAKD